MLRKLSRKRNAWCLVALLVALVASIGCGNAQEQADQENAARDARMAELQEAKAELDAMRAELAELQEQMTMADEEEDAEEEAAEGEEGEAAEDPAARIQQLENRIASASEEFYSDLVTFINENPLVEGEQPTERQQAAFRMKSEEDIQIAREYVDKGGDYRRAITILEDALAIDPDNELLQEELADVEAKRYMTEERFAGAEKGMNRDEVREVLGTPYHANVRRFEDDGVIAWFYPVDPQGSAAAVWFRQKGDHYEAYKVNFEEVVKEGPTDVTGSDSEDGDDV